MDRLRLSHIAETFIGRFLVIVSDSTLNIVLCLHFMQCLGLAVRIPAVSAAENVAV